MKVFEAKTLVDSMENRAKEYQELRDNLEQLKKKCQDIVNLDENFKGKGASAIQGFYQSQIDVIEAWLRLINKQIAFFNGIGGTTADRFLAGQTVVHVPFLANELPHADNLSDEMVLSQQTELNKIFKRIDDLVELEVFSKGRFEEHMERAEKNRRDTISAVDNLDNELKTEYQLSEGDEQYVVTLFHQLQEASRQGTQVSPIHFNAEVYKTSEVYQIKKQTEKQAKEYQTFKEEQGKFREELKKQEKLGTVHGTKNVGQIVKHLPANSQDTMIT